MNTANWSGALPTSSDTALIASGTATVSTAGPTCYDLAIDSTGGPAVLQITSGTLSVSDYFYCGQTTAGTVTQSGGTCWVWNYLYLGYQNFCSGNYNLSGGSLGTVWEFVGESGSGAFTQSGGTNSASLLDVGQLGSGDYYLGGGLLSAASQYIGESGSGAFTQTGGTNAVSSQLYLGYFSGSAGTYSLSGSGLLSAAQEYIGYTSSASALFSQTGGRNSASYLSIGGAGRYLLAGGTLQLATSGSYLSSGTLDGGNAAGTFSIAGSSIVDLTQGKLANTGSMTLALGPGSLAILPPGMGPLNFAAVNGAGLCYTRGTSLAVPAGNGFAGTWTINDPVACQGWIQAAGGPINLTAGLIVSGTGSVNLGTGTLTTQDATSGISGGALTAACQLLAPSCTGVFNESGGSNTINNLSIGGGGRYVLAGGTLQIPQGGLAIAGTLDGGNTAGVLNVAGSALVDFSEGVLANTGSMSVSIGANSLLVLSSTMNPQALFGQFSNAGMTHISGTTLTVSAGTGFAGAGVITDPVTCLGYINAAGGALNFAGGLNVAGSGIVNVGSGTLTTENAPWSLAGGSIVASCHIVGLSGSGVFTQSGGVNANPLYLGYYAGSSGTYNLTGGSLGGYLAPQYIGYSGRGLLVQSGGTNSHSQVSNQFFLGFNPGSSGTYSLTGGVLASASQYVGYSGTGAFTQSGGTNSTPSLYCGFNPGSSGTYNLTGGSLASSAQYVGYSGTGAFTQSNGTNSTPNLYLGDNSGSGGSYNLSGGSLAAPSESIGYNNGAGTFTQSGGTNASSTVSIGTGYLTKSTGSYYLSGGLLSAQTENLGFQTTGAFTQSGGNNSISSTLVVGANDAKGAYNLSSGSLYTLNEYIGYYTYGTGTFTQTGGTHTVAGTLNLGDYSNSSGTYALNGGLLSLGGFYAYSTSSLVLSGGTLQSAKTISTGMPIWLSTSGGNVTFDTDGNTLTLTGVLSGPGGIVKAGSGTLVIGWANTFSGDTTISAGTLQVGNATALQYSTVDIMLSGTLDLNGYNATLGGLSGNGSLALGSGTITVGNNSASTTFAGQLSGAGSLKKIGTGVLDFTGSNGYTGTTAINAGTLTASTTASVPNLLSASRKVSVAANATLALDVGGAGEWDSGSIDALLAEPGVFAAGALLGFDTSGGSFTCGGIGNAGLGIAKLGSNTLVLSGANSFGGNLVVSGGTLQLTGSNSYTGNTLVNAGTLVAATTASVPNLLGASPGVTVAAGATLVLPAGGATGWTSTNIATMLSSPSMFTSGANLGLDTTGGSVAINTKNGLGIVKLGPNLLVVSGTNSTGGNFSVGGGTLQLGSSTAMPAGASVAVANGTVFDAQGFSNTPSASPGTLSLQAGTFHAGPAAYGDFYLGGLAMTGGTIDCSSAGDYWLHLGGTSPTITISAAAATAVWSGANAQLRNDSYVPLSIDVAAGTTPSGIDLDAGIELAPGVSRYFVKSGPGVMRLTNSGNTAWITVAQGTLRVDDPTLSPLGSGPLTLDGGTLLYGNTAAGVTAKNIALGPGGGTLAVDAELTLSGDISGDGELAETGRGELVLSGTNSFGGLLVDDGTVQISGGDAIPSGANLTVGASASSIFAGLPLARPDAQAPVPVPEPGGLPLVLAAIALAGATGKSVLRRR